MLVKKTFYALKSTKQKSFLDISKGNYMIVFDSLTPLHCS